MNNALRRTIMRRIYAIYVLRRATSARALKLYVMLISTAAVASLVSISHVLENMPSLLNVRATLTFMASAFLNTGTLVQLLLVVFLGALIALGLEVFRKTEYARVRI